MKKVLSFLVLASILLPGYVSAAPSHDIQIDWAYSQPADDRTLAGYNLYMEGAKVCVQNNPSTTSLDCSVQAEDGTYDFTLTAFFTDNSETDHSDAYSFTLTTYTEPSPEAAIVTDPLSLSGDAPFSVAFNGNDSTGNIASYTWNFGDNSTGSGSQTSHEFATPGVYGVSLTVANSTGATDQANVTVNVTSPEIPTKAYNLYIEWSFDSSTVEGKTLVGYNLYKEGIKVCSTDIPSADNMDCNFESQEGTFDFTLTSYFTDDSESLHSAPYTFTLTSDAEPQLVAAITTTPVSLSGDAPFAVSFDGTSSTGDIVSYAWNFGDTSTGNGNKVNHTYTAPGSYSAILSVTSAKGSTSQSNVNITVNTPPVQPKAVVNCSTLSGEAPLTVNFSSTGTIGAASYRWSFGDGSTASIANTNHTFTNAGTYTSKLKVTSSTGLTDEKTVSISVQEPTPVNTKPNAVISTSPAVGEAPFAVSFDGALSSDAEGAIKSYGWSFGDGANATGVSTSYTYTVAGTYTAKLTVKDGQGLTDIVSTPVLITEPTNTNEAPIARITVSNTAGPIPLEVEFSGSSSTDPEDDAMTFAWNFGDGTSSHGINAKHSFTTVGEYEVTLTVTDSSGASSTVKTAISALESTPTFKFELDDIEIDHNWARVEFAEPFTDPVVIAGPTSYNNQQPSTIRLQNITSTGFEIRIQEWDYLDGSHPTEMASYLVMEKGAHTLEDGTQVEAGTLTANGSKTSKVQFNNQFSTIPAVVTAIATFNDTGAATSSLTQVDNSGLSVIIKKEEGSTSRHADETVGFIAWQKSKTTLGNVTIVAGSTSRSVKHKWYTLNYGEKFEEVPLFLAALTPQTGGNTATLRYTNRGDSSIQLKVEEEQSKDNEVRHSRETVSYLIFSVAEVVNQAPTSVISADVQEGYGPLTVTFDGSNSKDSDGTVVNYEWDFGDGNNSTLPSPSHVFYDPGTYPVSLTVSDDGGLQSVSKITVTILEPTLSSHTLDLRVESAADDGEERISTGKVKLYTNDLDLVFEYGDQLIGIRYPTLEIPSGATITKAYLEFEADQTQSETTSLSLTAEKNADAPPIADSTGNISSRSTIGTSVNWNNIQGWTQIGEKHKSPDLSPILQAVINQSDWERGNALLFVISGSGLRTAKSFDGNASSAPLLHLEYQVTD